MSQYPGSGPPPYYGPPPPWPHPPHHPSYPHHHPPQYPPPPDGGQTTAPPYPGGHTAPPYPGGHTAPPYPGSHTASPYPYFVPGTMMIPVPMAPVPVAPMAPAPEPTGQPTYITNYIYHGETSNPPSDQVSVVETSGDFDWVPTTSTLANSLTGRAVVGGHEGWDGSPLWVIRAWHNGDLIPGKLSVRHNAASIMYNGKEVPVQSIEVLCAKPENLRWIPASNGNVPPGAIPGGRTASGETLYIGRARYQLSVTPGKIHPSQNTCYIGFGGAEVSHKMYDALCRVS